ncbi:hypothetical protein [Krasilnikoviella flava]|uniref:ABC-2 family transporter protein n=1 Tax=Krasilnikoviella flava TaxID=526729 RepID=A0A1T5IP18_9MICO|nr:hypothetical protein [Krasilnikoviella flava]SKC40792.1 hypothetical protein SAMN04324258_0746 [Krasilnikoviella flava]
MSASVVTRADRDAFVARARSRATRRVARSVGSATLVIGGIFWSIFLVVTVAVPLIVRQAGGVMGGGVMTGAEYAAPWFGLSLGMIALASLVVPHVAAGGTRRSLFVGGLVAALVAGVAYGAVYGLLLLVERGVFGALGWEWAQLGSGLTGGPWAVVSAAAGAIAVAVYMLVGMAAQAAYRTFGVWQGTLLLLPGLALLVLVDHATRSGAFADAFGGLGLGPDDLPAALGLLQALVALALAAGWLWWQLRILRLRPTR